MKFVYSKKPISDNDKERLREEVLNQTNPLGAPFLELYGPQDNRLFQYLFDGHSTYLYERAGQRPSIIVGRKGSGKTTYLNNLQFKDNVIGIPVTTWTIMDEVTEIIGKMLEQGLDVRAERASYIWHWLFLNSVILSSHKLVNKKSIDDIVKFLPYKEFGEVGVAAITSYLKEKINEWANLGKNAELASTAFLIEDKTSSIDNMEREISEYLKEKGKIAIILLDNEENFLNDPKAKLQAENIKTSRGIAISGLLNYCSRANEGAVNVQIRYCIAAEQFQAFREFSDSMGKDFSNLHLLHWSVGELLSLIAHRYLLYLYVWKDVKPELDIIYQTLSKFDIYSRSGAIKFFDRILPKQISNGRGIPEETLTYLLRHFQILPRQLITLFNSIVSMTVNNNDSLLELKEQSVITAVHTQEAAMADEIIRAYKNRYPEAVDIRKRILPNMPLVFSYSDLREFYSGSKFINKGKDVLSAYRGQIEISPDRFERCLVETGIIGRLMSEPRTSHIGYINAEFEYSMPSTLDLSQSDRLVIHPIFSNQRREDANKLFGKNIIGVYPHDADPLKETNRETLKFTKFSGS